MTDDRIARMRQALIRLVVSILVVDGIAIAFFLLTDVKEQPTGRKVMLVVWMAATLAVVLPGLRAVRRIRREL